MRYSWMGVFLLMSACRAHGGASRPSITLEVENPSDGARPAANVAVSLATLGEVDPLELALFDGASELPLQVDDVDTDGVPDVLAFQVNLASKEHKSLRLEHKAPSRFPKRAHAVVHPEFEGPGWESDVIAYRMYLDGRNAIDVFGKAEPALGLDRYAHSGKSYHEIQPWGVDVLHVGDTLGCGSFGIWANDAIVKPTETLRTKPPNNSLRRFVQVVADGPVRSIVRFIYDNWTLEGAPRKVTSTMTIWAGKRWASNDLEIGSGWIPKVAVGVVSSKEAPVTRKNGFFYTFGVQSDPIGDPKKPEALGLGVVFRNEQMAGFVEEAPTAGALNADDRSRVALLTPDAKGHLSWAYLATWERGSLGIKDAAAMEAQCASTLVELTQPVSAKLK